MERVCFLPKIKVSRIVFNVVRQELNLEDVPIENHPNPINRKTKCIRIAENKNTLILLTSAIYAGTLHFFIEILKNNQVVRRIGMFSASGNVGYDYTRKTQEDFMKDCVTEFWKAYEKVPKVKGRHIV